MAELDATKATIVSIVPRSIRIELPHVNPSYYTIPPAKIGELEILVVGEATYPTYMGEGKSILTTEPAYKLAEQMIQKYVGAQLGIGENAQPGIFFVVGNYSKTEIKAKFPDNLKVATEQQRNWFTKLVTEGDDCWNKFHSYKAISDLQRAACKYLGLTRDWCLDVGAIKPLCPACKSVIPEGASVCASCRTIINKELYDKMKLQPASA